MIVIERNRRHTRNIPLTPLIDVLFVLLKFFILTTGYVDIEALKLGVVEEVEAGKPVNAKPQVVHELLVLGSGAAFLDNQLVYYGDLEDKLEVLFINDSSSTVMLKCDDKVNVQLLVDVLDMIKRSGGGEVKVSQWKSVREL